ncbi:hypothetical protein GCM10008983_07150 [Lentibacillus halophilus]|uniref:Uncharacterized protein n=1 Tax=Lentibacillus halophilus TaxID=295065 RepID=A0ABP3IYA3_9BACI
MGYLFLFLTGFGLAVTGGVTAIAYMNFLPVGISWPDYFIFIANRPESYFLPAGMLLIAIALLRYPNGS